MGDCELQLYDVDASNAICGLEREFYASDSRSSSDGGVGTVEWYHLCPFADGSAFSGCVIFLSAHSTYSTCLSIFVSFSFNCVNLNRVVVSNVFNIVATDLMLY